MGELKKSMGESFRGGLLQRVVWWDKVASAKSVNKLLLAASVSKGRLIVVTWYFMFSVESTSRLNYCVVLTGQFSRTFMQGMNLNKFMYV